VSRRSAPRRRVVRVWRTGEYATTLWHHELDCGHLESRKRRAPAAQIGCLRCEAGTALARAVPLPEEATLPDSAASLDADAAVVRARLAAALGVPLDAVRVEQDLRRIVGALVLLDPPLIAEITSR
jgi:hypothetical protein